MSDRVDAENVRACISVLRHAGWGWDTLSRATGIARTTIRNIATGRVATVSNTDAVKLAALPLGGADDWRAPEAGASARVGPARAVWLIEGLNDGGWSNRWIGRKVFGTQAPFRITHDQVSFRRVKILENAYQHLVGRVDNGMTCRMCGNELRAHDQAHTVECWDRDGNGPLLPVEMEEETK